MDIVNLTQSLFKQSTSNSIFPKQTPKHESNYNQPHQINILDESQPQNDDASKTPDTQHNLMQIKKAKRICQNQLKEKLIQLFRRNKQKNHRMCDHFMKDLGLGEHCDNIEKLIHFIIQNDSEKRNKDTIGKYLKYWEDQSSTQSQGNTGNLRILNTKLSIFPANINFITSTFSRDKVQILLQLYGTNHKILTFLNFLLVSLRSFINTNEKQWILMKDEVERYLSKYEHNVEKIYQIDDEDQEDENLSINVNNTTGNRLQWDSVKLQKTKQIKKISLEIRRKFTNKLTLNHYKTETSKVRKKLTQHQQTMCSALRKSCHSNYEKFKEIVIELKYGMIFIMGLIDKTERFKQSNEKYLIKQFLLESRKVGVESLIFLQQIYKHVVERLEQARRRISFDVEDTQGRKDVEGALREEMGVAMYDAKNPKQRVFIRQVEKIFHTVDSILLMNQSKNIVSSRRQQQQEHIDLNDRKSSIHESSWFMIQQAKEFDVEQQEEKHTLKNRQKNYQPVIIIQQQYDVIKTPQHQSQNEKFIASVIQEQPIQSSLTVTDTYVDLTIQPLRSQQTQVVGKQKKIKKRAKKEQEVKEKAQQLIEREVKIKKKRGRKPKIQQQLQQQYRKQQQQQKQKKKLQKQLFIIDSEDELNQSSSSLQFLSLGAKQALKETRKQADSHDSKQHPNPMQPQPTIKNNPQTSRIDDLQSMSFSIPLSIHLEDRAVNMDDFDIESDSCRYDSIDMEST